MTIGCTCDDHSIRKWQERAEAIERAFKKVEADVKEQRELILQLTGERDLALRRLDEFEKTYQYAGKIHRWVMESGRKIVELNKLLDVGSEQRNTPFDRSPEAGYRMVKVPVRQNVMMGGYVSGKVYGETNAWDRMQFLLKDLKKFYQDFNKLISEGWEDDDAPGDP